MAFPYLSWLSEKKIRWEDLSPVDQKGFSPYVIARILSGQRRFIQLVNQIQLASMTPEEAYRMYYLSLPTQKIDLYFPANQKITYLPVISFFADRWKETKKDVQHWLSIYTQEEVIELLIAYGKTYDEIIELCSPAGTVKPKTKRAKKKT